jgi:glyoxylase-like metal-dependent hydrolase (beta-lactamase superfamily II)
MKLRLQHHLAAFAGLLVCCLAAVAGDLVLQPVKVSAHVWFFQGDSGMASAANQGYMSNAGFVVTDDSVILFDALGTPVLGEAMLTAIKKITSKPVKRVIVSHYHADHIYGLQALKAHKVEIWAHQNGRAYLNSDIAVERLAQRRSELFPWVDEKTRVIGADRWLDFKGGPVIAFETGGIRFRVIDSSGAHSAEDIMLYVENDGVLFAGDLFFTGRIPFVGNADSRAWLAAMDRMLDTHPKIVLPGHGAASSNPLADMTLTRDYLTYLREKMGAAAEEMTGFEQAYQQTDWKRFEKVPAFAQANRLNAYGTYILMEQESLNKK